MPKNKKFRSGNPALKNAKSGTVQSYALDMEWSGAVQSPAYQLLAKVKDDRGFSHDYWIVLGLEHGFIGIPVGKEHEADMSALPGISWHDVTALGTAQNPKEYSAVTLAFEQVSALWSGHNELELGEAHQY